MTTIHFHCQCGQKLKATEASIGKQFDCPICGTSVTVPATDEVVEVPAKTALASDAAANSKKTLDLVPPTPSNGGGATGSSSRTDESADNDTAELSTTDTTELPATKPDPVPHPSASVVNGSPRKERRSRRTDESYRRIYADTPADGAAHVAESGSTADTARDLYRLVRKMKHDGDGEEKRKPKKKQRVDGEGLDFGALFAELGRTVLPAVLGLAVACTLAYWLASSVMSLGRNLPELGEVSGVVTLDGEPLTGATVTFIPIIEDEEAASRISSSVGLTDEQGRYELMYVKDVEGAAVGLHQVIINAPLPNGRERLPRRYNFATQLSFDVQPGSNDAPFDLTTK